MKRTINVDEFLKLKEKPTTTVFIFLLNNEYAYLEYDTSWLNYFGSPIYLVRMNEDDFHMMDIAIHPKIIITASGKELSEINGLPKMEVLREKLRGLS